MYGQAAGQEDTADRSDHQIDQADQRRGDESGRDRLGDGIPDAVQKRGTENDEQDASAHVAAPTVAIFVALAVIRVHLFVNVCVAITVSVR
jgi:hypothetical protein